jgi:hypothetical protein
MEDPEAGDPVARILDEAQQRQHVLTCAASRSLSPPQQAISLGALPRGEAVSNEFEIVAVARGETLRFISTGSRRTSR